MAFKKYDQIFLPEFSFGGMECPGIVMLSDTYLFNKGSVNQQRFTIRALTVLHELSHMWFGNLTTM